MSDIAILTALAALKKAAGCETCDNYNGVRCRACTWDDAMNIVDEVCVEDEARGRWILYPECLGYEGALTDEHIVCSCCKSVWNIIDNDTDRFDYCPSCGAKMDGGDGT